MVTQMGLRFYIGGSGAGKSYQLYRDVIEWSKKNPRTNYLVIVPDQFTMQTQKDIVDMHDKHGIMNIDVLSFGRLSYRIFEEVGGNDKPILDDTGKSLILRKVASTLETELPAIGSNLKKIGYIHEVKSAISEFMQYSIGSKELEQMIECAKQRGSLQYKLKDLKVLYDGFTEHIKEKFITTEESLTLLKNVLHKSEIIKNSVVVFDGFTGFTPIQNALIQELMCLSTDVIITSVIDGQEDPFKVDGEQKLFHLTKKTIANLEKLAEQANVPRGEDIIIKEYPVYRYKDNPSMAYLEHGLFRFQESIDSQQNPDNIQVFELADPQEEVRFVCRKIHELIRTQNYKYRNIAVVTGDLNGYAHFVENEFEKFQIPCFIDQTRGIILNPFIEYMRSGITVLLQNFSYESMFHFLRSGLVSLPEQRIDRMENYAISMGIRGRKKWSTLWTRRTREMGKDFAEELEALNEDRAIVMEFLAPLLEKTKTVEDLVQQLYAFVVRAGLQQKLANLEAAFKEQNDLARAREYAQIYRLVMDLLNQIVELLGQEEMSLKEFSQILDAGFGEIQVGTIPQNVDQVVVGDIERTRLKEIKALFFIGINDGIIPKSSGTGGLISDIDREFLNGKDFELAATPRQQMYTQRLYLYMNLTKPTEMLWMSYVNVNGEGKSLRKAYLIGTIQKLFPKLTIQKVQEESLEEQLVTPRDGLHYLVNMLRAYAANQLTTENETQLIELHSLFNWYQNAPEYGEMMKKLSAAAFYEYYENPISKAVAHALYGKTLENSVSRLEKYASCAYAHFLQYGLSLQERKEFTFENVDMGNVFHGVLEAFAGKIEASAYTWFDFPEEVGAQFVEEALDAYALDYGDTVLFHTERNAYMIQRMKRILRRAVKTLQYQLKKGLFKPNQFELSFSVMQDLDSVNIALSKEERMRLHGRIDRIDTYEDEEHVYVKVIDYKSGNKSFDLVAMYYGLQLQLVVYLNAAMELAAKNHSRKEIVPAAVLYYHVADPVVERVGEAISPEELNAQLLQELKTKGVVNAEFGVPEKLDTSQTTKSDVIPVEYKKDGSFTAGSSVMGSADLKTVSQYVSHKIKEIGSNILAGDIAVTPYERGMENACTYCSYAGICGYDSKIAGFQHRKLDDIGKDEVMEQMKQEIQ